MLIGACTPIHVFRQDCQCLRHSHPCGPARVPHRHCQEHPQPAVGRCGTPDRPQYRACPFNPRISSSHAPSLQRVQFWPTLPDDVKTLPLVTHSCRLQWITLLLSPRPPHVPPQHITLPSAATGACNLPSPPPPPQVPHPSRRPFIIRHRRLPVAPSCGAEESFWMVCRASEVMADIKFSVFEENKLSADAWQPRHHLDHFSLGSQLCTTPHAPFDVDDVWNHNSSGAI